MVENKIDITTTVNATDINTSPRIFTYQEAYTLDQTRYRILRSGVSLWNDWTTRFLFILFGSLITLVAKILGKFTKNEELNFDNWYFKWEVWVCIISVIAFLISLLISYFSKSERKVLIREIDEHFEKSKILIKVENQS